MKMAGHRLVLFPLPLKSHMNAMLQLGTVLHSKGFSISVICVEFNSPDPTNHPMFTFHFISDGLSKAETSLQNETAFFATINKRCRKPFKDRLFSLVADSGSPGPPCLITDGFWHFAREVAHNLNLRALIFLPSSISGSRTIICYKGSQWFLSLQDKDMETVVPELSPLRMKDVPKMNIQDPAQMDELMVSISTEIKKSDGIVFNSFKELESEALEELEKDLGIPIFPCGPLEMANFDGSAAKHHKKCMSWLDQQKTNSVIYISLGTIVSLTNSEIHELTWGIATSNGHPFLLVVRRGMVRDSASDQDGLLPNDIMGDADKGLIVEWAPQKELLAHPAVGGFLTHAGWNSTMESICAGVPMICMPFLADQFANARYVSEAWKIGFYFEEKIDRSSIQKIIRTLMDGTGSNEIRRNMEAFKYKVQKSLQLGGSSYECLENLVQYING